MAPAKGKPFLVDIDKSTAVLEVINEWFITLGLLRVCLNHVTLFHFNIRDDNQIKWVKKGFP